MDFTSEYLGYVLSAYGLSALVLGGLVVRVLATARRLRNTQSHTHGDSVE